MHRIWRLGERSARVRRLLARDRLPHAAPCPAWLKEKWIVWLSPDRMGGVFRDRSHRGNGRRRARWLDTQGIHQNSLVDRLEDAASSTAPGRDVAAWRSRLDAPAQLGTARAEPAAVSVPETWHEQRVGVASATSVACDEGRYLSLADRSTDLILSSSMPTCVPAEVEAAIDAHPSVLASVVIGLPDADLGQRIHAIAEVREGAPRAGIRRHARVPRHSARRIQAAAQPRDDTGTTARRLRQGAARRRWRDARIDSPFLALTPIARRRLAVAALGLQTGEERLARRHDREQHRAARRPPTAYAIATPILRRDRGSHVVADQRDARRPDRERDDVADQQVKRHHPRADPVRRRSPATPRRGRPCVRPKQNDIDRDGRPSRFRPWARTARAMRERQCKRAHRPMATREHGVPGRLARRAGRPTQPPTRMPPVLHDEQDARRTPRRRCAMLQPCTRIMKAGAQHQVCGDARRRPARSRLRAAANSQATLAQERTERARRRDRRRAPSRAASARGTAQQQQREQRARHADDQERQLPGLQARRGPAVRRAAPSWPSARPPPPMISARPTPHDRAGRVDAERRARASRAGSCPRSSSRRRGDSPASPTPNADAREEQRQRSCSAMPQAAVIEAPEQSC